ncbi:Site-specific recombinase XerD [Kaistia soli DSM 19436]|uniref:Site-specific recombinase XerD n=2 Tax=Kaistia TaxID=166953 RepID=A0A1M5PQQ6_9HYPH|nr:Site-specific recombinase XerD [Kaistia soli DSM 19436]
MVLATNIVRRAGSANYSVRKRMPKDLWQAFGNKLIWRSLGTPDPEEAKRRARRVLDELDREFDDMRARTSMSEHDIQEAVWSRYNELVDADERFRQDQPDGDDLDEIWRHLEAEFGEFDLQAYRIFETIRDRIEHDQAERAQRLTALKIGTSRGDTQLVAGAVMKVAKAKRVALPKGSSDYKKLAQGLQRAELEALQRAQERDEGDFSGVPRDRLVKPPVAAPAAAPGRSIPALFERYVRENPKNVKPDTLAQTRMAVKLFIGYVGERSPVTVIDKLRVGDWKDLLLRYPVKAAETKIFAGLSLEEIVACNDALPEEQRKPPISPKTVNRYMAGLSAFANWLVPQGHLPANPLLDMFITVEKDTSKPVFSTEELTTLFSSPLFTGCQSDEKLALIAQPGNLQIRDHRYWLPLVMLWSGARPAEIAQLLVKDVREQHGKWIMHITEEGSDDKSMKTKGSMRVVPIHTELVRLGFVDFAKAQKEKGEKHLFPEAERNSRGQMAAKFSRDFGRYLEKVAIKEGRGPSLYSFRHGSADALRRAEYLDEEFAMILGHAKHTQTGRYGHLPEGMLRQRVELVEAIAYPGLDLSHLYPATRQGF